ncbi:MAG: polyamine aminopropyltransferase [Dehalococcoidales bacterium]|nr:polyamine aminopropyltransferase [Dehalococcoidales bacterium]
MDIEPDKWFQDKISRHLVQMHSIEEVLYTGHTRFQAVDIMRTGSFGMCLVLDGKVQSTEADEFIYHEALVHPAILAHPHPEKVFIAGGGEGATLRETLAYKSVKRAVMIDIDEEVVDLCRKHLPAHSRGAFEDGRTELHHVDAREYLAKHNEKYDVIIIDLPDPIEEGPAYLLYTREFYQLVRERLTPDGIMSVQSGPATLVDLLNFSAVYNTLRSVFTNVSPYKADIPSFGITWGFCLASFNTDLNLSPAEIDRRISARKLKGLKFYDGTTHQGMLSLPKYMRETLSAQTRIIADNDPLFIYHGS